MFIEQHIDMLNDKLEELSKNVRYGFWEKYDDDHTVIRFATDWATEKADVEKLLNYL